MTEKKQRKKWKDEDMVSAMSAVREQKLTISKAAATFNVPRKTLDDRVKGLVKHGSKPGPPTALTSEQEDALEAYLFYMAEHGYPLTRTMVKAYGWAIAKRSGCGDRFNEEFGPGDHWWLNFKRRHPKITLRKVDMLERSRAEALNADIVDEYFKLLSKTLDDCKLKSKPRQIYNCDETFLPLDCTREKAVTCKGAKNTYCQSYGTSEHITLLCCASAAGIPHPPMIIYAKSFPGGQYRFQGPEDALYARSESGWIDSELFLVWLKKIFLRYVVPERPVILLTDGHKTHVNIDVIDVCRQNDVVLFCLPPHTTHALQPLDVAVFKSLKDAFAKAVRALSFTKKNFVVSKKEFARVVKHPLDQAFSISNVKAGFLKCGIYPYNPDAIAKKKMVPSSVYQISSSTSDSCSGPESSATQSPRPLSEPLLSSDSASHLASPVASQQISNVPSSNAVVSTPLAASQSVSSVSPSAQTTVCSTPTSSAMTSPCTSSTPFSPVNPLVAAGLIPGDLSDILITPPEDAAVAKKRTRRIVGARHLTSEEYTQMLRDEVRKKKEAEELKEQKKVERERKRNERLEKQAARKKEIEARKKKQGEKGKKRKRPPPAKLSGARRRIRLDSSSDSDISPEEPKDCDDSLGSESVDDEQAHSAQPGSSDSRSHRRVQLPARFRDDIEDDDGVVCAVCKLNEPQGVSADTVFWVDCDVCGVWVHNYCVFKNNAVSRRYKCKSCQS